MPSMGVVERDVLAAYKALNDEDSDGAFAPYYHSIIKAAGGDVDMAYAACKSLKKRGYLAAGGKAGKSITSAPSYWILDAGIAILAVEG